MRAWIKGGLLALSVFALSWSGAVYYWRSANQMPSTSSMFTFMLALPLALLGGLWITRRMRAAPPASAATAPPPASPAAPLPALAILGAALSTAHGASADELATAIQEKRARPSLDAELEDESGFPVLSTRIAELSVDAVQADLEQWCCSRKLPVPRFNPEQWRALSLGSATITELAHQAASEKHNLPATLHVHVLLRTAWDEAAQIAAQAWIETLVTQAGWPGEHVSVTLAMGKAANVVTLLEQLSTRLASSDTPLLALVAAFDSQIGQSSVDLLASHRALFTQSSPHGLIPGEGAVGLLLANEAAAQVLDPGAVLMHPASAPRTTNADESRRPDATTLLDLLRLACLHGAVEPAAVGALVSDAGHRSSRVMETMALANQGLPHLDPGADVSNAASACGSCGAVPQLAALALACHHLKQSDAPVLCIGTEDPHYRSVVLLRPAPQQT